MLRRCRVDTSRDGLQVYIAGGDNVYGDCFSANCSELREAYATLTHHPSFVGAKGLLPMVAVIDDHDAGQNDCGETNPYKDLSKQMFLDFWQLPPDDPRRRRDGLYTAYRWGPPGRVVQVILLDTRSFRDDPDFADSSGGGGYLPVTNPEKTMLGSEQWAWLEAGACRRLPL